jgi:hypothetical protein
VFCPLRPELGEAGIQRLRKDVSIRWWCPVLTSPLLPAESGQEHMGLRW